MRIILLILPATLCIAQQMIDPALDFYIQKIFGIEAKSDPVPGNRMTDPDPALQSLTTEPDQASRKLTTELDPASGNRKAAPDPIDSAWDFFIKKIFGIEAKSDPVPGNRKTDADPAPLSLTTEPDHSPETWTTEPDQASRKHTTELALASGNRKAAPDPIDPALDFNIKNIFGIEAKSDTVPGNRTTDPDPAPLSLTTEPDQASRKQPTELDPASGNRKTAPDPIDSALDFYIQKIFGIEAKSDPVPGNRTTDPDPAPLSLMTETDHATETWTTEPEQASRKHTTELDPESGNRKAAPDPIDPALDFYIKNIFGIESRSDPVPLSLTTETDHAPETRTTEPDQASRKHTTELDPESGNRKAAPDPIDPALDFYIKNIFGIESRSDPVPGNRTTDPDPAPLSLTTEPGHASRKHTTELDPESGNRKAAPDPIDPALDFYIQKIFGIEAKSDPVPGNRTTDPDPAPLSLTTEPDQASRKQTTELDPASGNRKAAPDPIDPALDFYIQKIFGIEPKSDPVPGNWTTDPDPAPLSLTTEPDHAPETWTTEPDQAPRKHTTELDPASRNRKAAQDPIVDDKSQPERNPLLDCTTSAGRAGRCVKPQFCRREPEAQNTSTLFISRVNSCHYLLTCCAVDQVEEMAKPAQTIPTECGWSNPGGYGLRSTGLGSISSFGDFPWMVALLTKITSQPWTREQYIGGGTLIHPSVVLTVAHKVDTRTADEIKCRAGEWDAKTEQELLPHQDRDVEEIVIHEDFNNIRAYFDAALLFLETPFTLEGAYHIGLGCLARALPAPGTPCYSMGWGSSFNDNTYAHLLKKVKLPLVDPVTCQRQLRNTVLGSNYQLHHSHTCAGGEAGVDTCVGDGGSSLVCPLKADEDSTRYAVYGMVVYGVSCGRKSVPGVYAKIPSLLTWVNQEMEGRQLDTSTYVIS